jgi:hypothetical protein
MTDEHLAGRESMAVHAFGWRLHSPFGAGVDQVTDHNADGSPRVRRTSPFGWRAELFP